MAWTKKIKKIPKKAYKKVYGSRKFPQAVSATGKVAKDVASLAASVGMIMSRLNVEKKSQSVDLGNSAVGQTFGNVPGNVFYDLTPAIVQGTDDNQRIGNSLKLTGMNIPIQFSTQANCYGNRRLRVQIFKILSADNGVTPQEAFDDYYDTNPLNGLRDMNAPRKYRTAKQDGIKLLRTKFYSLKAPTVSIGGNDGEIQCLSINLPLKMDDVIRFDSSANTSPDGTRYFMVIQCDAGNAHPTASSSVDIPVSVNDSGVNVRACQKYWWVDN